MKKERASLRELREKFGVTQVEMAKRLGVSQPSVSKLESSKKHRLSTVRKYVEALGGKLTAEVTIPEGKFILQTGALPKTP